MYPAIRDAKAAVRWVRAHAAGLGVDPDTIIASGSSGSWERERGSAHNKRERARVRACVVYVCARAEEGKCYFVVEGVSRQT